MAVRSLPSQLVINKYYWNINIRDIFSTTLSSYKLTRTSSMKAKLTDRTLTFYS